MIALNRPTRQADNPNGLDTRDSGPEQQYTHHDKREIADDNRHASPGTGTCGDAFSSVEPIHQEGARSGEDDDRRQVVEERGNRTGNLGQCVYRLSVNSPEDEVGLVER